MTFITECTPEHARTFANWIATRGGLAVWKSANLANPSASWTTPVLTENGEPHTKPTWEAQNAPTIVKDPAQVGVYREALFKAFRVSLRVGGNGMSLKLTDAAQRRVDREMAKCREQHGDAHYRKGVLDIDGASIGVFYTTGVTPLSEWKSEERT